jgi:hypothetical protein
VRRTGASPKKKDTRGIEYPGCLLRPSCACLWFYFLFIIACEKIVFLPGFVKAPCFTRRRRHGKKYRPVKFHKKTFYTKDFFGYNWIYLSNKGDTPMARKSFDDDANIFPGDGLEDEFERGLPGDEEDAPIEGILADEAEALSANLIPKPGLCLLCKNDDNPKQIAACNLIRLELEEKEDFSCPSYVAKK